MSLFPERSHLPNLSVAGSCHSLLSFVYIDHGAISCCLRAIRTPGCYSSRCIQPNIGIRKFELRCESNFYTNILQLQISKSLMTDIYIFYSEQLLLRQLPRRVVHGRPSMHV